MTKIMLNGNKKLTGDVSISGMKNNAVAILPGAILTNEEITIDNIPDISDIKDIINILKHLNVSVERKNSTLKINSKNIKNTQIPKEYSSKLRASYYFMGALLARYKEVSIYFPGGCNLGDRPIDQHIKGFEALGATVTIDNDLYTIKAKKLNGAYVYLDMASVGATINIIYAAVLAKGKTVIENAAKEPEVVNIATMLNTMGAKISGAGTNVIKIEGVKKLNGCYHEVLPDRIEAGTYMIIAALLGNNIKIKGIIPEHVEALTLKFKEAGIHIVVKDNYCVISKPNRLKPLKIKTMVFPGFVTDLQQPITPLLTQCEGESIVEETIYEDRFRNIPYLNKMGANIVVKKPKAYIKGKTKLIGKEVIATDLRAGISLVIAGLIAKGTTTILEADHILRGYEKLEEKLTKLGAEIRVE
ncbi:MAG: UDP-N-acetylglucosamine 1-carboxyvinyltransferase [Bacilli bacterium]